MTNIQTDKWTKIKKNEEIYDINDIKKDMNIYDPIIQEYRKNNPFWKRYQDFLIFQKEWEYDQFISERPAPRIW